MAKMERQLIGGGIPVWMWQDKPLIKIGKDQYVTATPLACNIRSLKQAKEEAEEFSKKYGCSATVSYDTEWNKLCEVLDTHSVMKAFAYENELDKKEALLLDSNSEGDNHVLAAGLYHCLNEIFSGFISGDDSDGEPQPEKLVFLTIKIE